jgi:Tol biopolymer transport system component
MQSIIEAKMKKFLISFLFVTSVIVPQQKRIMTIDDLWAMQRLGSYSVSPDGGSIIFSVTNYSMDLNKGNSDIYYIKSDGSGLKEIKNSEKGESAPLFTPDGGKISYVFDNQVWISAHDGSAETKITNIYTGASGFEWSPDGKKLLFVSSVYPDCTTDECNKTRDDKKTESKVTASIFTELMYRHWDDWRGDKRSHLFLLDTETKELIDLTLMSPFDVPPIALGSSNDYSFSPDGKEVAYTMNTSKMLATSTNNDIFILNLADVKPGLRTEGKLISTGQGNDNQPVYSPDGK